MNETAVVEAVRLGSGQFLVIVHETEGPDVGRQLTVQVRLGRWSLQS
ncbi:hypothetical protein [Kribbella sp. C-35]